MDIGVEFDFTEVKDSFNKAKNGARETLGRSYVKILFVLLVIIALNVLSVIYCLFMSNNIDSMVLGHTMTLEEWNALMETYGVSNAGEFKTLMNEYTIVGAIEVAFYVTALAPILVKRMRTLSIVCCVAAGLASFAYLFFSPSMPVFVSILLNLALSALCVFMLLRYSDLFVD